MKLVRRIWLLTKEKEVTATILGYNYKDNTVVAQVEEQKAIIRPEDISIYQSKQNTGYIFSLIGSTIKCTVESFSKKDGYILSRSKFMAKEAEKYNKGDVVTATIVSSSDKALYLEFDEELSGIMYLSELTTAKIEKPLDLFKIGDKIRCVITKKRGNYFELSRLKFYNYITLNIRNGKKVLCKITKKLDDNSGYFVEVTQNPNYSGIFDITEENINKDYVIGEKIPLRIIHIKDDKKQLKLRTI